VAGDQTARCLHRIVRGRHKKISKGLETERDKLYAALQARNETLAEISHDLRNPVNVISLASSKLAERDDFPIHDKRFIEIINRSARQMDRMIQDLLDIANVEASRKLPLERQSVPAKDLLSDASDLSRPSTEQKAIDLRCDYHDGEWMVDADRRRVLQVFCNLIDNAVKFCPRESTITLGASREDKQGVFWVSDNGPGIPADEQDKIFQPFWHKARPGAQGSGLGLAIARKIVAQHGGHLWIEGGSGAGTTFRFTLPLSHAFAVAGR
jgi:signal transduction histidine kinase